MKKFISIITFGLLCISIQANNQNSTEVNRSLSIINDVLRQLDINYVDTLNFKEITEKGIGQMLYCIDPYTVYIPKEENDNLKMMTTGKYGGIGAIIIQRDSSVYIHEPYEGMPAQQHDVLAGDKLIEVDGMNCLGKTTKEVSDRLRGKPGTLVKLKLLREGEKKPLIREFERQEVHLPAVSYYQSLGQANLYCDSLRDIAAQTGYILFSEFTTQSAQQLLLAVEDMVNHQHIQNLIIDLRGNGGGLIDEAIQIVSYFVERGTEVVSTRGKVEAGNRSYTTRTSPLYKDMPVVLLVDEHTASAAEIVSGSLQDLHRAKLVGKRTFGKGLVQSIRPIAFDGHLKVTTAHYYLPSGRCIQAIDYSERQKGNALKKDTAGGILPDIVLTDTDKVNITYSLYSQHMFFDYATRYHRLHDSIAVAQQFEITDQELDDFIRFLDEKQYKYETETSKYYKEMLDVARHEDVDSVTLTRLEDMQQQLTSSYREAIMRHKQDVKKLLAEEILLRYYFQQGRIAYLIRDDEAINRALEELMKNDF